MAVAALMVTISGLTLGIGIVGTLPVIQNILGSPDPDHPGQSIRRDLPALATDFNEKIDASYQSLSFLKVPAHTIQNLPTGAFTALFWILLALCGLTVIGAAANFTHAFVAQTIVNDTTTRARRQAFVAVMRAPLRTVARLGPSDLISRIVNDSTQLANGLNVLLSKAVLQVFKGVSSLAAALFLNWQVTLAALTVAPLLYTVIRRLGKRIKRYSKRALSSQAGLYQAANEALSGLRIVKVQTAEIYETGRFHRINKQMLRELNKVRTARAIASPLTEMLTIFVLCGLTLVAGRTILKNNVDPADFILVVASLAVAGASLKPLSGIINDIQTASPAADRLEEALATPREPGHEPKLQRLPRHAREIAFENVSFAYAHENSNPSTATIAVDGVTLRIPHGSRVAFVGPNGCGKTTLLSMVPRLFDPDAGRVAIDGTDIRDCSVRSLREQIGMVAQDTVLFQGTIAQNIAYGSRGVTVQRIIEASKRARAHEFIEALPMGYDTVVGESGQGLSGGQRQRLSIARAILRDPAILVLDEATSMIDAESEARITEAVEEFSAGRTTLIVAHRLATVLRCDRIVVMDAGRIVDAGRHEELLTRCDLYQRLFGASHAGHTS